MTLDRPNLSERYASATETSHLEVLPHRCPVDYIVAAGWAAAPDGLGSQLLRLRTEFDSARGDHRQAIVNSAEAKRHAVRLQRAAEEINAKLGAAATDDDRKFAARSTEAARLARESAERQALTARALLMVHLKTLPQAKLSLHNFAQVYAMRKNFMAHQQGVEFRARQDRRREAVGRIAARVLDVWIDPACPHCDGRGFNGGYTEPVVICEVCNGSTNRIGGRHGERLHGTDRGHDFGLSLLDEVDRKVRHVLGLMRKFTSQASWRDSAASQRAQAELRQRLEVLRSDAAMED